MFHPIMYVTGGQTGGDSAPLIPEFYPGEHRFVRVIGTMPNGFQRHDGKGKQIAEQFELKEGGPGFVDPETGEGVSKYEVRDKANVDACDGIVVFLSTKPDTGRGSLRTLAYAMTNKFQFIEYKRPRDDVALTIYSHETKRPALLLWDLDKIGADLGVYKEHILHFYDTYRPNSVMIAGNTEETCPGLEKAAKQLIRLVHNIA